MRGKSFGGIIDLDFVGVHHLEDVGGVGTESEVFEDVVAQGQIAFGEAVVAVRGFVVTLLDGDGSSVKSAKDGVPVVSTGVVPEDNREGQGVGRIAVGGSSIAADTDVGSVVDGRLAEGLRTVRAGAVVLAGAARSVNARRFLQDEPELAASPPSEVVVHPVVTAERHGGVLNVDRTAEPLNAVVQVCEHLDKVDRSSGTDATQGKPVDFVSGTERKPAVADTYVAENAAVVFRIISTVARAQFVAVNTLNTVFGIGEGYGSIAKDDKAAPFPPVFRRQVIRIRDVIVVGGKDDGCLRGAFGVDRGTPGDNKGGSIV